MIEVGLISNLSKAKQKKSFLRWTNKFHFSLFFQLLITIALLSVSQLSHAAEVTLAWNSSNQVSGYVLYYGLESRTYENMIDVGNNLQHTVTNLNENQRYYFAVSAYNEFEESEYSDEISYKTAFNTGNEPPTANAGADQTADEADTLSLDGSYSSDPDDGIATFHWEQIEGTAVELSDASAIEPNFICPAVGSNVDTHTLTFRLTVTDYSGVAASDTVNIYVNNFADTPLYFEYDPIPSIRLNGSHRFQIIRAGTPLSIELELDSADYSGYEANLFLLAMTPTGEWYYFDYPVGQWRYAGSLANILTSYQGPLFDIAPTDICVVDTSNLFGGKRGKYTFYFAVDPIMDGAIDIDAWYNDKVTIFLVP